jgi:hypothetical protein
MNVPMKVRITAEMVVGRGLVLHTGEVVDIAVFGEYADFLVRESAIELLEPIISLVDVPQHDTNARMI